MKPIGDVINGAKDYISGVAESSGASDAAQTVGREAGKASAALKTGAAALWDRVRPTGLRDAAGTPSVQADAWAQPGVGGSPEPQWNPKRVLDEYEPATDQYQTRQTTGDGQSGMRGQQARPSQPAGMGNPTQGPGSLGDEYAPRSDEYQARPSAEAPGAKPAGRGGLGGAWDKLRGSPLGKAAFETPVGRVAEGVVKGGGRLAGGLRGLVSWGGALDAAGDMYSKGVNLHNSADFVGSNMIGSPNPWAKVGGAAVLGANYALSDNKDDSVVGRAVNGVRGLVKPYTDARDHAEDTQRGEDNTRWADANPPGPGEGTISGSIGSPTDPSSQERSFTDASGRTTRTGMRQGDVVAPTAGGPTRVETPGDYHGTSTKTMPSFIGGKHYEVGPQAGVIKVGKGPAREYQFSKPPLTDDALGASDMRSAPVQPAQPARGGILGDPTLLGKAMTSAIKGAGEKADAERQIKSQMLGVDRATKIEALGNTVSERNGKIIDDMADSHFPAAQNGTLMDRNAIANRDSQVKAESRAMRDSFRYTLNDMKGKDGASAARDLNNATPDELQLLHHGWQFQQALGPAREKLRNTLNDYFGDKRVNSKNVLGYMPASAERAVLAGGGGYRLHLANGNTMTVYDARGGGFNLSGPNDARNGDLDQYVTLALKNSGLTGGK